MGYEIDFAVVFALFRGDLQSLNFENQSHAFIPMVDIFHSFVFVHEMYGPSIILYSLTLAFFQNNQ